MVVKNSSSNGHAKPKITSNEVFTWLMTAHRSPFSEWAYRGRGATGGRLDSPNRDLNEECGYVRTPQLRDYYDFYSRVGVAARAVNIWPDECWAAFPEMYETETAKHTKFERAWEKISDAVLPWHFLHRVDRLSGIGRFGVLLLGLPGDLETPVRGINPKTGKSNGRGVEQELLYLRVFDETLVRVASSESDSTSPRFNQPTFYNINFNEPFGFSSDVASSSIGIGNDPSTQSVQRKVHWTRVIHIADNCMASEVYGIPRLQQILNNVHDIRKVSGSSAEMFWKGGFPGYSFQTYPDLTGEAAIDEESVRNEVEAYVNGLQRFLTAVGGEWKSLAPQVADPASNLQWQINLLCLTIGVPTRIFLGTEAGHLASTQDAGTWKERLRGRQKNYLEPKVVRPFVDRLILAGCLPPVRKNYIVNWRDLQTLGDKDRADVALKKTQALMQFKTADCRQMMPERLFYTLFLGMTENEADAVQRMLEENPPPKPVLPAAPKTQGGGRIGNPAKSKPGRPAGPPKSAA